MERISSVTGQRLYVVQIYAQRECFPEGGGGGGGIGEEGQRISML